jgi:hypothetical protein
MKMKPHPSVAQSPASEPFIQLSRGLIRLYQRLVAGEL